jgi:hypothetical protein
LVRYVGVFISDDFRTVRYSATEEKNIIKL